MARFGGKIPPSQTHEDEHWHLLRLQVEHLANSPSLHGFRLLRGAGAGPKCWLNLALQVFRILWCSMCRDARRGTAHLEVVGGHHSDVLGLHTSVHQGLDVNPHQLDLPWDRNRV